MFYNVECLKLNEDILQINLLWGKFMSTLYTYLKKK